MTNKQAQITINAIKFMLDHAQYSDDVEEALNMAINALTAQPEERTETHACDLIDRQKAIDAIWHSVGSENGELQSFAEVVVADAEEEIKALPSAQPEWNNHTVACLLAEIFGDTCACNYNDIDEWLPEKCELLDSCPNPVGVACWEQFLKHKAERREG